MSNFIVEGGKKLAGSIETSAGKNAPIALLCASLLVRGEVILKDMTHVEEVLRLLEILESIGVSYKWQDDRTLWLDTSGDLDMDAIDKEATEKTRASILLIGALAARIKKFKIYKTGGCKLGERTIRPHLYALQALGIDMRSTDNSYVVKTKKLVGSQIVMYESGDTATENAIMAAVLASGTTKITFASANYMVQDVCYFLQTAGAKIEGIGTTTLIITGVEKLHSVSEYYISPDPVDAMAWIALACTTKSPLTIKNCPMPFLQLELQKLSIMGQKFSLSNTRMSNNGKIEIVDIAIIPSSLTSLPDKLYGRPFPGFNIDNVPLFIPILTQAKGQTLVHEWCYENRAIYGMELKKLGGEVMLLDTHRLLVTGPSELVGNEIVCPPALRPGMAVLIAMIAAKGQSILRDAYMIERGYEDLIERLQGVGVNIIAKK